MADIQQVIRAAKEGGKVIKHYFGEVLDIEEKSHASDFRTKADLESEEAILKVIKRAFPTYNIYSEEAGKTDNGSNLTFVIDPLDGSNNFVLGVPNFTVSIALMDGDETILAVVYNPILDQTYYAEKGKGAFLDGKPIHVNNEADIKRSTICYTCGYINSNDYAEQVSHKLNQLGVKRQTNYWSPAYDYCLLASGRMEGIINNKNDLYDYAAGKMIVREAGGKVTDFKGDPVTDKNDVFIASNGTAIHETLLSIV